MDIIKFASHRFLSYHFLLQLFFLSLFSSETHAQSGFQVKITNDSGAVLPGATVNWKEVNRSYIADNNGFVFISTVTAGRQHFVVSYIGFERKTFLFHFPLVADSVYTLQLIRAEEEEEEEVIVTATRTSGTLTASPTRVEVLTSEEMDEKGNMVPGDIRMVLNESTGIQTQQTSATSYNSSIRIQGLDGRYTQILRDGFPLYAGFSGGLSIMQIAPLDLKQVEVIKGSSSTLYGGGAIAGLVNLVSKLPGEEKEISFMANATTAGGLDLSSFYSQRFDKIGITVFASRNTSSAFDPADIGLTAIPSFQRYTVNPRIFLYGNKTTIDIGGNFITENRVGGNVQYIKKGTPGYFEKNHSIRYSSQLGITHIINDAISLQFKNSYSRFNRTITLPSYRFSGKQSSTFSELTLQRKGSAAGYVAGLNLLTDDFKEARIATDTLRNSHLNTFGSFMQYSWSAVSWLTIESGFRFDYVQGSGWKFLPRLSSRFQLSEKINARIGGGLGYKTPTVFNEESERMQFRNILPVDFNHTVSESSVGGNLDINYKTAFGHFAFSLNQLFFYTRLKEPLIMTASGNKLKFVNATGYLDSKGLETNMSLTYKAVKLYVGYTYTDVNTHYDNVKNWFPLTPRHRLNYTLVYEKANSLKAGVEAYYNSPQKLNDGSLSRDYWMAGVMVEKIWKHFSVFLNFENFTDTRQTKFDSIYTGSIDNPVFRDIYAPVDGFVANGGIKIRL
jgi:iron complex outermembrane receptor protein